MSGLSAFRTTPWHPSFSWVETAAAAAAQIALFHADSPLRAEQIEDAILSAYEYLYSRDGVGSRTLKDIHQSIYSEKEFAGRWRKANISTGSHTAPTWADIPSLMKRLRRKYLRLDNLETLERWYSDFESILPFQVGNGQVGGVAVCAIAHSLYPDRGWYAANQ